MHYTTKNLQKIVFVIISLDLIISEKLQFMSYILLVSEMTYYVSSGTLNLTHSFIVSRDALWPCRVCMSSIIGLSKLCISTCKTVFCSLSGSVVTNSCN